MEREKGLCEKKIKVLLFYGRWSFDRDRRELQKVNERWEKCKKFDLVSLKITYSHLYIVLVIVQTER